MKTNIPLEVEIIIIVIAVLLNGGLANIFLNLVPLAITILVLWFVGYFIYDIIIPKIKNKKGDNYG